MGASEGIKRVKTLGTRIAIVGGGLGLLLCIAMYLFRGIVQPMDLVLAIGLPVCFGAAIRVIAWLLQGFIAKNDSEYVKG